MINKILIKFPKLKVELIEKDILIDELLEIIINEFNREKIMFYLRGGTSLLKCYLETNRMSEDIDITIISKSSTQSKKDIQTISRIFNKLEGENVLKIVKKDDKWDTERNFLNAQILYKNHSFEIDIKSTQVNNKENKFINLQEKSILNIYEKFELTNKKDKDIKINVLCLEYVCAEKLIAFHKNYLKNKHNKRAYRHLYDIFMIFDSRLLNNNHQTWLYINEIYDVVINEIELKSKDDFNVPLRENVCFNFDKKDNDLKNILSILIDNECYVKASTSKIIDFFINLKSLIFIN